MAARPRVGKRIAMALLIVAGATIGSAGALVVGSRVTGGRGNQSTEVPTPSGGGGDFGDVSCTSVGNCTAVGYDEGSAFEPMVATETNGNWGAATDLPSPAHDTLTSVSCSSPGNCAAVGKNPGLTGVPGTPVVAETNGVWGTVRELSTPSGAGQFYGVSCTTAGGCTAVGGDGYPIIATEANGVWSAAVELTALGAAHAFLGVSCTGAGDCTAVGSPSIAIETNGVWSATSPLPGNYGDFWGVSCTSAANCTAVGEDNPSDLGTFIPMVATETNGVWGATSDLSAPSGAGELTGVSCTSAGDCTAAGYDEGSAFEPMVATETNGNWGAATDLSFPGDNGDLGGVSCPSAGSCTAAGYDQATSSSALEPVVVAIQSGSSVSVTDKSSTIPPGGTLTFTATVTGSGGVTPTGALTWTVTDPNNNPVSCSSETGPTGSGSTATYTCSIADVQAGNLHRDRELSRRYEQHERVVPAGCCHHREPHRPCRYGDATGRLRDHYPCRRLRDDCRCRLHHCS